MNIELQQFFCNWCTTDSEIKIMSCFAYNMYIMYIQIYVSKQADKTKIIWISLRIIVRHSDWQTIEATRRSACINVG